MILDESRRLAFLAAMDITVWVPRTGTPAEEPRVEPVPESPPRAGARPAREVLRDSVAAPARTRTGGVQVARTVPRERREMALTFASAGPVLFVDEMIPAAQQPAAAALLGAIAFALSGNQVIPELQAFDWPPPGVSADALQTRDAVMGRLRKFRQERRFECLVLLGPLPAGLLLGWTAEAFAARGGHVETVEGLDCPVVVTLSTSRLLAEPLLKREAWRDLRAAVRR